MSINKHVTVNTHYTRSVNLERDAGSVDVINAYIPTSRALRTFTRVSDAFNTDLSPRAWSLIGPYGSGKSSFSVFLSQLLSNPVADGSLAAQQVLKKADELLAKKFSNETNKNDGYLKVLITGAPESMSKRLVNGLANAAEVYWKSIPGRSPRIINELKNAATNNASSSEIVVLVIELQKQLEKKQCQGILLIIDELGKFLEYEARHYGANDIYLLQALAEHACKGSNVNLFLFVLLHQSFEQYAKGLGENLKNEWSKVQGRFEEVPFLESAEQILRVVSAAFEFDFNDQQRSALADKTAKVIDVLVKQEAIPSALKFDEAVDLYSNCYPLHPVSALILPLLCQKVAQNERTLFSYLGSYEEYGLQHMLNEMDSLNDYVYPHHIYDYFITNQPSVLGDYLTHRRWAEVVTAIERLGDASEYEVNILKTIGLLNIIGSKGGFKASKAILETCLPKKTTAKNAIKALQDKSIINYRRFNNEYRVWQGSDFDLEEVLQEEVNNIGQFSLAEELNTAKNMLPIVARKYTIQTGALRYFVPIFVDAKSYKTTEKQSKDARIIFYLASDQDDEKIFHTDIINYFSSLDIVALSLSGAQLREAVAETIALKRVRTNSQELNSDPVAKREFEDRLTAAEQSEDKLLKSLIESPADSIWYHNGNKLEITSKRAMQEMLSNVLDKVYDKMPRIFNELINRDKPSAQANAARNKLLYAMQNHASETDLGIDKFPAEKAIYRAVLRETGLHQLTDDGKTWHLSAVSTESRKDKSNLRHVWQRIDEFLDSTEKQSKSFADLNAELMAPPYGVKAGLLPVFYIAAYLVYQHELAVYEQRRYKPYFTEEMLERFVKRPDEFEFQRFKHFDQTEIQLHQYASLFNKDIEITTAEVFRAISLKLSVLSNYSLNTEKGLTKTTKNIRDAFYTDASPEKILFNIVPNLLNLSNDGTKSIKIIKVLNELEKSYDKLLISQANQISLALRLGSIENIHLLRNRVVELLEWMAPYTQNVITLKPFIIRAMQKDVDDKEWLENILMYLAKKQVKDWLDKDIDSANEALYTIASKLLKIEKNQLKETREDARIAPGSNVYLLSCVKKNGEFLEEVATINSKDKSKIDDLKATIAKLLEDLSEEDQVALFSELTYEYLSDYKTNKNTKVV